MVIPYIRFAIEEAKKNGTPRFGILSEHADGSGKVESKFGCEFIEDVALIIDAPSMTEEDRLKSAAKKLVDQFTLKHS